MVVFDKGPGDRGRDKGSTGVNDIPVQKIQTNTEEAIEACRGQTHGMDLPESVSMSQPLMVYGSYARGTAVKGESDIDIIVPVLRRDSNPTPILTNLLESCLSDNQDILLRGMPDFVEGVDITVSSDKLKYIMAMRFALGDGRGKEPVIYDLEMDRYDDIDIIVENISEQIANGELGNDDIDIVELEASPLDDFNINIIKEAMRGP